jgi:hypothetical protein
MKIIPRFIEGAEKTLKRRVPQGRMKIRPDTNYERNSEIHFRKNLISPHFAYFVGRKNAKRMTAAAGDLFCFFPPTTTKPRQNSGVLSLSRDGPAARLYKVPYTCERSRHKLHHPW